MPILLSARRKISFKKQSINVRDNESELSQVPASADVRSTLSFPF